MTKEKQDKKDSKNKSTRLTVADLMIPIVSGVIFLLVLFFILIPSIQNSNSMLTEIENVQDEQKILKRNLEILEGMDFVILQKDLSNARKVLPRRLEVAQFAYYIDSLAGDKGLNFRELKAGDMVISREDISNLEVNGIRVPMGYVGDYEPILDFFNELQIVSPYVISFGHKVDLRKRGTEDENNVQWALEIDVTGYYVEENIETERRVNVSMPFRPYDFDADMVEEFNERVERLID